MARMLPLIAWMRCVCSLIYSGLLLRLLAVTQRRATPARLWPRSPDHAQHPAVSLRSAFCIKLIFKHFSIAAHHFYYQSSAENLDDMAFPAFDGFYAVGDSSDW